MKIVCFAKQYCERKEKVLYFSWIYSVDYLVDGSSILMRDRIHNNSFSSSLQIRNTNRVGFNYRFLCSRAPVYVYVYRYIDNTV